VRKAGEQGSSTSLQQHAESARQAFPVSYKRYSVSKREVGKEVERA